MVIQENCSKKWIENMLLISLHIGLLKSPHREESLGFNRQKGISVIALIKLMNSWYFTSNKVSQSHLNYVCTSSYSTRICIISF